MRIGFLIGFLIGAAVASFWALAERAEPAVETPPDAPTSEQILDRLSRQAREAKVAAEEAARQKEEEVLREYEEAKRRAHSDQ
jgi:uncharacterized membrane protein